MPPCILVYRYSENDVCVHSYFEKRYMSTQLFRKTIYEYTVISKGAISMDLDKKRNEKIKKKQKKMTE